jgi:4-amino-4-deoxy-L-arabinose transferase-like glycosyltransferase
MAPPNRDVRIGSTYLLVFAAVLFLLFFNLDGRPMWGDEAETAVLAKNVLRFGVPLTVDGVNTITLYGGGVDANADQVWTWSPWLQQYLAAGSYAIFGATTWASRAPFALIAWFSVALLAGVTHQIYRNHWITLSSVLLMGSSELFLLHARQARYYAVSVFGELILVWAIYQALRRRPSSVGWLAFALTIQFYSNYIVALANIPVLVVLAWMLFRGKGRPAVFVPAGLTLSALGALPWLLYARPWQQAGIVGGENALVKAWEYAREFHFHFVPIAFGLLPVAGWLIRFRRSPTSVVEPVNVIHTFERYLLLLMPLYLVVILLAPAWFLRYLLPLLPVACMLVSVWVFRYLKWRVAAVALVLVQCSSNVVGVTTGFAFGGGHHFRSPLADFVGSITHPYSDRFTAVLDYLNKEARPGQTLLVLDPEFPLMFYTRLRIIDGRVNRAALADGSGPDWVLAESASGVGELRIRLPPEILRHYETIAIDVPNSPRGGGMPEPDTYDYRTAERRSRFIVYKKRSADAVR